VNAYHGDCNGLIDSILSKIERGKKFVLCFVDPSSLVYRGSDGIECDQLHSNTVRSIAQFPRSELLLNFPLESILRCAGDYFSNPEASRAIAGGQRITTFMGSTSWQQITLSESHSEKNRRAFLEIYMNEALNTYPYKGAFLVRSEERNLPVYYLVYATNNGVAAKIMRDVMKKEGDYGLHIDLATGKPQTLDQVYPLNRFIFD
jgi:three-Cys-motif partner protein